MAVAPVDEKDANDGSTKNREKPKHNYSRDLKSILALKIPESWLDRDLNLFLELCNKYIIEIKNGDWSKVAEGCSCTVNDCCELIKALKDLEGSRKNNQNQAFLELTKEVKFIIITAELNMADLNCQKKTADKNRNKRPLKKRSIEATPEPSISSELTNEDLQIIYKHVEKKPELFSRKREKQQALMKETLVQLSEPVSKELNKKVNVPDVLEKQKFDIINTFISLVSDNEKEEFKRHFWKDTHPTLLKIFDNLEPFETRKENFAIKEEENENTQKSEEIVEESKVADPSEPSLPETPIVSSEPLPKRRGRPKMKADAEPKEVIKKPSGVKKNFRQTRFLQGHENEDMIKFVQVCLECESLFKEETPSLWETISKEFQERIDAKKRLNYDAKTCEAITVALKKKLEEKKSKLSSKEEPLRRLYDLVEPVLCYFKDSVSSNEFVDKSKRERVKTAQFSASESPTKRRKVKLDEKTLQPFVMLNRVNDPQDHKLNGEKSEKRLSPSLGELNYEMKAASFSKTQAPPMAVSSSSEDESSDTSVEVVKNRFVTEHVNHQEAIMAPSTSKVRKASKLKKKRKRRNYQSDSDSDSSEEEITKKDHHRKLDVNAERVPSQSQGEPARPANLENQPGVNMIPHFDNRPGMSTMVPNFDNRPGMNTMVNFDNRPPMNNAMVPYGGGYGYMEQSSMMMLPQLLVTQMYQTNQFMYNLNTTVKALTEVIMNNSDLKKKRKKKKRSSSLSSDD